MNRQSTILPAAFLLLLPLFLGSCHKDLQPNELAWVGDHSITREDLQKRLSDIGVSPSKDPNMTSEVLNRMVDDLLIASKARKEDLDNSDDIRKKVSEYQNHLLKKALLKKEVDDKIKITDADIAAYYAKHQKEIRQPGYVELRQVVFPNDSVARREVSRLKQKGGFRKAITKFKGGPVGKLYEGTVPQKFVSYFFGLPEGSVSGPLSLKDGVHYFRIDKVVSGQSLSLEQAREGIRNYITSQKKKSLYQALVNHLRSETTVTINDKALASLIASGAKTPVLANPPAQALPNK